MNTDLRVCIVSASGQNVYFEEILAVFADALIAEGIPVEHSVDCFPPLQDGLIYLFVPHEFHPLVEQAAHPHLAQLRRSVAVCTEQPGTPWFDISAEIAALSGGVVDINQVGIAELNRRGIKAELAPLGYVPSWDRWRRAVEQERPIDLTFLGGYAERRALVLARCADRLSDRRVEIHMTESARPHVAGSNHFLAGEEKWNFLSQARLLLNVHRGDLPYFEWHRVIGAALNGCVVVTEHSRGCAPFVPGEHFISAGYEDLPLVLEGLLADEPRLDRMRCAAYDLVKQQMPLSATSAGLIRAIENAGRTSARDAAAFAGLVLEEGARSVQRVAPVPMPRQVEVGPAGWQVAEDSSEELKSVRMALKHLVVRTKEVERRLADLTAPEQREGTVVERLGPEIDTPQVSVLLTVYNYADHVGEAIESVALSEMRAIELIAVDDASSDHSVDVIREASRRFPWLPITLIRCKRNQGLPAARNLAADFANADLVFILDADNQVYRSGLRQLTEALDANPKSAFAYGLIQRFDLNGPVDVMNWLAWDPERLRYGNYIDAMSMIRRSELGEVGGYSTDGSLYGWEDFALWVAMADAGKHGIRIPNFVARYRASPHSMIALTDIDQSAAWAALLRRYPSLASAGRSV